MQAGDVLGNRYHLIDLVGKGRSEVFLARDGNTSRLLAVKVIKKTSKDQYKQIVGCQGHKKDVKGF